MVYSQSSIKDKNIYKNYRKIHKKCIKIIYMPIEIQDQK